MAKDKKKGAPVVEQADGRKDDPRKLTLDDMLGNTRRKYSQTDIEGYKIYLKGLNLTDMQAHAQQLGLIPISERRVLEGRLVKEFQKTASKYFGTQVSGETPKVSERVMRILATGR